MKKALLYDYSLMMKKAAGKYGFTDKDLENLSGRLEKAHKAGHEISWSEEQGFMQTLFDKKDTAEIRRWSKRLAKDFNELLVIGIGGSDLGARALQQTFQDQLKGVEVFFLGDTTDPLEMKKVFSQIKWRECAMIPVSKSGNTVETLSVFLAAREQLVKMVGNKNHAQHVFVMTERKESIFHDLIHENYYAHIHHPANIGGRWSVLSVVGLLSAAASGVNTNNLKKGARDMYNRCDLSFENPAMTYAAMHYLGLKKKMSQAVLMPYSSRLDGVGAWYRQLFAESLGKAKNRKGKKVHAGLTPIVSIGPRDQHSQIQLYNEGPFDKLITMIRVETDGSKMTVPKHWEGEYDLAYLNGKSFHDLLLIEQESTAVALAKHKRPNGAIVLPDLSEYSIGQLLMFFELSCVYLAELMDIDAFDQPGVEEGKKNMFAMLGKEGFEKDYERYQARLAKIEERVV